MSVSTAPRDLFSLVHAPMSELLEALLEDQTLADRGGPVPARALQISDLIVAEAVRLIRLGTRTEVTEDALQVAQALIGPKAESLETRHPDAFRQVCAASTLLGAASAASSSGGEMMVLRSWNGKAKEALSAVVEAPDQEVARNELKAMLGLENQSFLALLIELEAAGLMVQIRDGAEVIVHLGIQARTGHVRELLA